MNIAPISFAANQGSKSTGSKWGHDGDKWNKNGGNWNERGSNWHQNGSGWDREKHERDSYEEQMRHIKR